MKHEYDYLLVGAGLFNAVFAQQAKMHGKRCLVIDKRPHLGGNMYCENVDGITVHKYGPHIFHTSNKEVWDYVNSFVSFNRFTLNTIAYYKGRIFNLPFNMNTFHQIWGVVRPEEAKAKILQQTGGRDTRTSPFNLEEQAIALVGKDIYETLIKGYTEKQWGRPCSELPAFIIKRLPVRYTYDNNYYNDCYQGVPDCARMHKHVENLLRLSGGEICIQYIFSSFNENLEDSNRYLIFCYFEYGQDEALSKFADWYLKDKFNYEKVVKKNAAHIHTIKIEREMERHREWRNRTSLIETPTILVNGYKLPDEYEIEDLAMIVNTIKEENVLQDINGKHAPLAVY